MYRLRRCHPRYPYHTHGSDLAKEFLGRTQWAVGIVRILESSLSSTKFADLASCSRLLSVSITTVSTQVIKVCVGRPRPDMISRCQPIEGAADLAVWGLSTMERVCTVQTGHSKLILPHPCSSADHLALSQSSMMDSNRSHLVILHSLSPDYYTFPSTPRERCISSIDVVMRRKRGSLLLLVLARLS